MGSSDQEMQQHILNVMRDAAGPMDQDSLQAAVNLKMQIQAMQAALNLLLAGKILGSVDKDGEVILAPREG